MLRKKISRENYLYFDGTIENGLPHTGYMQCLLGPGIKNPITDQVSTVVLFIGRFVNGVISGVGRFHFIRTDRKLRNRDHIWAGKAIDGIFSKTNVELTDIPLDVVDHYLAYINANLRHFVLTLGVYKNLAPTIQRWTSKDDEEVRDHFIREYAQRVCHSQWSRVSGRSPRAVEPATTWPTNILEEPFTQRKRRPSCD